jgi:hypothetical protein
VPSNNRVCVTNFEFRALPGLPPYGEPARAFSSTGTGTQSEGLVVTFTPDGAPSWTGNFARGLTKLDLLVRHPNGQHALIIAGGQGYIVDPSDGNLLEKVGGAIVEAFPHPTQPAIVLNHQNLRFEALGSQGRIWLTRRISWDHLRSVQRHGTTLTGEAWKPDSTWHPFQLNLDTGEVIGGSYDEPTATPVRS